MTSRSTPGDDSTPQFPGGDVNFGEWLDTELGKIERVDLTDSSSKDTDDVHLTPQHRLRFARQVLLFVFLIVLLIILGYGFSSSNRDAWEAMFELVKVGALPLVTLVIGFYFPSSNSN